MSPRDFPEWPEVLPILAARVAEDSGRDLAEVTELLDAAHRDETSVDVEELVEALAPTVAALQGPVLMDVLRRLDSLTREDRMPFLVPLLMGILPSMVAGVMAVERARAAIDG